MFCWDFKSSCYHKKQISNNHMNEKKISKKLNLSIYECYRNNHVILWPFITAVYLHEQVLWIFVSKLSINAFQLVFQCQLKNLSADIWYLFTFTKFKNQREHYKIFLWIDKIETMRLKKFMYCIIRVYWHFFQHNLICYSYLIQFLAMHCKSVPIFINYK